MLAFDLGCASVTQGPLKIKKEPLVKIGPVEIIISFVNNMVSMRVNEQVKIETV
jgi:hypothetical protein